MKLRLLLIALCFTFSAFAQNKLSKSKQTSVTTFVYKITDAEVISVLKDKKVNENFYHSLISSDYYREYKKRVYPLATIYL